MAHTVLLRKIAVGAGSWPVSVPLNPTSTVPPFAAIVPFQLALVTVTVWPVCDHVPFQPDCTPSPAAGQVNVMVQPLTALVARLVMVIPAPKPPDQLLLIA